jgi:hydroxymethylpyrimidine/phosphomethylpyrimidine kinase
MEEMVTPMDVEPVEALMAVAEVVDITAVKGGILMHVQAVAVLDTYILIELRMG